MVEAVDVHRRTLLEMPDKLGKLGKPDKPDKLDKLEMPDKLGKHPQYLHFV
jgi:hypothetical protein